LACSAASPPIAASSRRYHPEGPPPGLLVRSLRLLIQTLKRHSLSLAAALVVLLALFAYILSNPASHSGAFFGNAIADWTGVFVSVLTAQHLSERKVRQRLPPGSPLSAHISRLTHNHSLSIFLSLTRIIWILVYLQMNVEANWGQVVGSLVPE
jgi:hypothetical protein